MIYLRWDKDEITGLERFGLSQVVTECAPDGSVLREVGFDSSDRPVHRAPDPSAKFFMFDLQLIELNGLTTCMSVDEFNAAWHGLAP